MSIRILHTSDLHALAPLPADQRLVVDRLLDDVKRKSAETAIDLIVFSGDLGATGQTVEFEVGRRKLLDRLSALTGLGPDRVVLVPGNHDVDKDAIEEIYEDGLRSRLTSHEKLVETLSNDRHVSQALGRMDSWIAFTDAFYGASDRQRFAPGAWTRRLDIRGTTVGIASLNSAWRSTGIGEQERGTLLVGDLQARTAVDQIIDCDIRLIVVHHPLEWLAEFDRKEVRREFERAGAIVMTGHEHESDSMHLVSGMGAANHSRAGCLYFGFGYPNAYSLIDLELSLRRRSSQCGRGNHRANNLTPELMRQTVAYLYYPWRTGRKTS